MAATKFEALEWADAGNDRLERSRRTLSGAPNQKVRDLAGHIPAAIAPVGQGMRLVFAGQYSAGKSTIVRALTGRADISAGAGITTEQAHTYDWNGVTVIDTPGVHTEIRPDHDEITYRTIADADLLVFVVTNELFDSRLATHFRKLAIERDKGHEMMLVVNKMRRCVRGNNRDAQDVIREDLRKVLAPLSPEQLRTSFIDAEAALESRTDEDPAGAQALLQKSSFEAFIHELNAFVRETGLTGRFTTSLYTLEQVLQEGLAAEPTGDKDIDALEELLLQRRRALLETQQRMLHAVEGEVHRTGALIRKEGRNVADSIHGKVDKKEVDGGLRVAQERVQSYADQLGESVQAVISKHMIELDEHIGAIANSALGKELLPRLGRRIEQAAVSPETLARLRKASDISRQFGEFLVRNSFTPTAGTLGGLFKLNQYSGTNAHGAVKAIGHVFGKSFKPWEAVKWTRAIANAGRVLAVAGTLLTVVLQFKEDADAAQRERDLRETRSAVRSGFNDAAHEIEMHYNKATGTYVAETLTAEIDAVDKQLAELRGMLESHSQFFHDLVGLLEETRIMIRDLHSKNPGDEKALKMQAN